MTYEYECEKCGAVNEVEHGMNDTPDVLCQTCGGKTRRLVTGGTGYIFKCGGFYSTTHKPIERYEDVADE